jgi:hypothetical protein
MNLFVFLLWVCFVILECADSVFVRVCVCVK